MKKLVRNTLLLMACVMTVTSITVMKARAENAMSLLESLHAARSRLVDFIGAEDATHYASMIEAIHKASDEVDGKLHTMMVDPTVASSLKGQLEEFRSVWESFKTTREDEIIPAVQSGNIEHAKEIAGGIQAERFKTMAALLTNQ